MSEQFPRAKCVHAECERVCRYAKVEQPAASPAQLSAREFLEKQPRNDLHEYSEPIQDDWLKFAEAYRDASQRQPQSVSEDQLQQKAADEIVLYLAKLHNAGMMNYVNPPTILSIMKSAFKEEL